MFAQSFGHGKGKRSYKNKGLNYKSSTHSKENKKNLSHFNLNGIITLGGKGLYNLNNRGSRGKLENTGLRPRKANGYTFSGLKKNFSGKQNVLYNSMNGQQTRKSHQSHK